MSRSLVTTLISGALFPLHERLKGHDSVRRLRRLEASQWLPRGTIEERRIERLRGFLREIGRDVPYYARQFEELGFEPAAVRSVDDLAALPLLTKADIRANEAAMRSKAAGPLKRYTTGGSSGEPLIFYIGRERVSHDVAAKWRATRWWDVDIGDPEVVVWGSPVELSSQDRIRTLRDKLFRTHLLPAFEMSASNLDRFVSSIRSIRPRMLFGYPSALAHIARHAQEQGQRMDDLGIRVAFVTSELLYDDQKSAIEQVFGCPTANGYGARDAGFIAHQCPAGGMHISAEDIVVEIFGRNGQPVPVGETGEIVVTHLATSEFPFLRYRTGDIGAIDETPCACGRGLPRLTRIEGRATDFVVAQDGTVVHGLALIYTLRDLPGVAQFRIVQHDLGLTEVEIVATTAFQVESERRIVNDFRARLGAGVDVRLTRVGAIPAEASGKHRYVTSHVGLPTGAPSADRESPARVDAEAMR